ncbi:uncharacterized protein BJ171DRAFT_524574 [Polychytrium aggregatum]|uniref:uncharacterized protein n=1 Tax=Polychytrium aggregatum TaxID=110093 RepID=UPI0022FE8E3C|nr:uncharacterized protein BJ171DRAFT_524574 [Polychytrium aggregatum]KAI9193620.1 hypothetical protein BJ171DRAFT_524574 [Polychytrium aggregatum]
MPVPETQAVPSASPMMLAQSPMISIDSHDSAPQDRRSIPAQRHASLLPGQGGLSVEFPGLDRKRSMTLPTIHVDMSRQHSEVDRTSIQDVPRLLQVKADNGDAEAALEVAQIIATDMPVDSPRWDQAARYFQKSADALNIEACFEVAWLHFVGLGLHKSDLDGFNYWKEVVRRSADPALRHMSLYMLGWCSFLGRGAPSNRAVATECFRSSAQDGFVLGEQALDFMWNQDVDKMQTTSAVAKRFFERCALLSPRDPLLAHLTAACLLYGFGTARDQSHALQILEQQSDQGFHPSQALLGCCYFYGFGVNRDHRTAAHWFARAAEHDNPYAQVNLALCYEKAYGVPQNFSQSTVLYKQAAVQGSAEGQRNLGHSYFYGRGTARDHAKAVEWYRRSADQGNVEACDDLGQCFKNGLGVQQNYAKAIELFSKAAKGGNVASLYHIGLCYYYGHGVGQSYELAAQFLQNAAEKGDNNAQNSLAICYTNGRGIPVDLVKAVEWFRKAAEGGNPDAMLWMGINYSRGHGVMQDNNEAKRWLLRAADKGNAKARELYSDLIQKEIMASDGRGARQNPPRAAQHNNNRVAQGSGGRNEGNPFARQPTVSETLPRLHP